MKVIQSDETVVQETRKTFDALDQCMSNGMTAWPHRLLIGDRPWTSINRACIEGWKDYRDSVEETVKEQIAISKSRTNDGEATSLIDFMLASDIYKNDLEKLVNELIILKLGGTDTSRNATIIALCHLIKN